MMNQNEVYVSLVANDIGWLAFELDGNVYVYQAPPAVQPS